MLDSEVEGNPVFLLAEVIHEIAIAESRALFSSVPCGGFHPENQRKDSDVSSSKSLPDVLEEDGKRIDIDIPLFSEEIPDHEAGKFDV